MRNIKKEDRFNSLIDRLLHILMLNSRFIEDLGLFNGKIGISIVYANCYKQIMNPVYYDCMCDMIDDVLNKVHVDLNLSFKSGLAGIGWGLEYLMQNGFVNGSSLVVCENIDNAIMKTDPRRLFDVSLENGIEGLFHYVIYHLQGVINQKEKLPFDETYLADLYRICIDLPKDRISRNLNNLLAVYRQFYDSGLVKGYNVQINDFVNAPRELHLDNLLLMPLGLNRGIAGIILNIMSNKDEKYIYIR